MNHYPINGELERLLQSERPFSLRRFSPSPAPKTLLLGPHPDDFDEVGVTMRWFHDNGSTIRVGVMRTGSGVEDTFCSPPTLDVKAALRDAESAGIGTRNNDRVAGSLVCWMRI